MAKRIGAVVGSLVVSAIFLWWALRGISVEEVFGSILGADPFWSFIAFAAIIVGTYTRAHRWRGLVNDRITVLHSFYILGITQMMNMLPLRLGEAARAVLATREGVPVVMAATSIVVERLMDTTLVLILLSFVVTQVDTLPPEVTQTAPIFGVLAIIAFAILLTLARYPQLARNVLAWIEKRVPILQRLPLESMLDNVLEGLQPLINGRRFLHAVWWSLWSWFLSFISFYAGGLALGLGWGDWQMSLLSLTLASFSVAIPLTVAALGPFEGAVQIAGRAFNIEPVISTAMGFLVHGTTMLGWAAGGIAGLLGLGIAVADVLDNEKDKQPADDLSVQGE